MFACVDQKDLKITHTHTWNHIEVVPDWTRTGAPEPNFSFSLPVVTQQETSQQKPPNIPTSPTSRKSVPDHFRDKTCFFFISYVYCSAFILKGLLNKWNITIAEAIDFVFYDID